MPYAASVLNGARWVGEWLRRHLDHRHTKDEHKRRAHGDPWHATTKSPWHRSVCKRSSSGHGHLLVRSHLSNCARNTPEANGTARNRCSTGLNHKLRLFKTALRSFQHAVGVGACHPHRRGFHSRRGGCAGGARCGGCRNHPKSGHEPSDEVEKKHDIYEKQKETASMLKIN